MSITFVVGEKFSTFQELKAKFDTYKEKNFVDVYVRDSRTVKASQKRLTKIIKPELQYL